MKHKQREIRSKCKANPFVAQKQKKNCKQTAMENALKLERLDMEHGLALNHKLVLFSASIQAMDMFRGQNCHF